MNRKKIFAALAKVNTAIAGLLQRLHPPPEDFEERLRLEDELQTAYQTRAALETALRNLPKDNTPAPDNSPEATGEAIQRSRIARDRASRALEDR